jgi:hypothetical protein
MIQSLPIQKLKLFSGIISVTEFVWIVFGEEILQSLFVNTLVIQITYWAILLIMLGIAIKLSFVIYQRR